MNILLVTPWKLSAIGGVSSVVRMLASQFHKKGHQVLVLTLNGEGHPAYVGKTEEASVYSAYLRAPYVENAPLRAMASYWLHLPGTLYRLHRFLIRHDVNVVAIQFPLASGFYFAILRWISSWKLVVTYQGSDAHELPCWPTIDRFLVKCLLSSSDCIMAVSKSLHAKVMEAFPSLQRKRCCFVSNGAPLDLIDQNHPLQGMAHLPARYVFSAGLLIYRKGFDVLIKAIRLARDRGVEIEVVVAGEGPEREALETLADEVGVLANVRFVGGQSHRDVLYLMKHSRYFVLASRAEGMPLVIAEAMACGKAVVATNVDGASEIIQDGKTGILVKSDDAGSLAEALIKLYTNPVLCETLATDGKDWARKEFSWEAIAGRYLKLFDEL